MNKLNEILLLNRLEENILLVGKIDEDLCYKKFPTEGDSKRLNVFRFYDLQSKYSYGWYIAEQSLEEQLASIEKFKLYILENYKED